MPGTLTIRFDGANFYVLDTTSTGTTTYGPYATQALAEAQVGVLEGTQPSIEPVPRPGGVSQALYGIPGAAFVNVGTDAPVANQLRYHPFRVEFPLMVHRMMFEVTVAPASAARVRFGIYAADGNVQPQGDLLVEQEVAVASGFTGVKDEGLTPTILRPGYYLTCMNVDVTMTMRTPRDAFPWINPTFGNSAQMPVSFARSGVAYGALPSPGLLWWDITYGTSAFRYHVMLGWGPVE